MSIDGGFDALLEAMLRQCVLDNAAGPGTTTEQRRNWRGANSFLDEASLLEKVCEANGTDYQAALASFLEFETRPATQRPKVVKLERKEQPALIIEQRAMLLLAA